MTQVNNLQYLDQVEGLRVEPGMQGQSAAVLLDHGSGVPPPAAAEQVQRGQGLDVGDAAGPGTEPMTETTWRRWGGGVT